MQMPFAPGDRIVLDQMVDDPDPIPAGTTGTVVLCTDLHDGHWQVVVQWDCPRLLTLIVPPDRAHRKAG